MFVINAAFTFLFCLCVSTWKYSAANDHRDTIAVDLRHASMITSPLKSGSDSKSLLKNDFSKTAPVCLVTLPLIPSWILVDLGYAISGISQIRLHGDHYLNNGHELLTGIDIQLTEYISPSILKSYENIEFGQFIRCGNTGTVPEYTYNVVVDCYTPSKARWVLIRRQGQLNLCYVQILQSLVKPECFQKLSPKNPFYLNTKESLSIFRFNKHFTFLKCQQNCDLDHQCAAVAFVPSNYGTGTCQLLRQRVSKGDFACDGLCRLRINRCHLGSRIVVKGFDIDKMIGVEPHGNSSYALSVEISAILTCDREDCGTKSIFLINNDGVAHKCGSVDPSRYRILSSVVFICEVPVWAPKYLLIKSDSPAKMIWFKPLTVAIRLVTEESFALNFYNISHSSASRIIISTHKPLLVQIYRAQSIVTSSYGSARLKTTSGIKESWTSTKRSRQSLSYTIRSRKKTTSTITSKKILTLTTSSKDIPTSITWSREMTTSKSISRETPTKTLISNIFTPIIKIPSAYAHANRSTARIFLSPTTNTLSSSQTSTVYSKFPIISKSSKSSTRILKAPLSIRRRPSQIYPIKEEKGYELLTKEITNISNYYSYLEKSSIRPVREPDLRTLSLEGTFGKEHRSFNSSMTNASNIIPANHNNNNNTTLSGDTIERKRQNVPLTIVLIFGSILVLVTTIAVIVTFADGHRREKLWTIPTGGLGPSNGDSLPL